MSLIKRRSTLGRCTFTATSRPVRSLARCTWYHWGCGETNSPNGANRSKIIQIYPNKLFRMILLVWAHYKILYHHGNAHCKYSLKAKHHHQHREVDTYVGFGRLPWDFSTIFLCHVRNRFDAHIKEIHYDTSYIQVSFLFPWVPPLKHAFSDSQVRIESNSDAGTKLWHTAPLENPSEWICFYKCVLAC